MIGGGASSGQKMQTARSTIQLRDEERAAEQKQ
jgi:hypothetical protein